MGFLTCLDVGCGDASVIESESAVLLIDCHNIDEHKAYLPSYKRLCAVFITHQHKDHYSGLEFLKDDNYKIDHLIYSPYERRVGDNSVTLDEWNEFEEFRDHFENQGTVCHSPYRQNDVRMPWKTLHGIEFRILGPFENIAKDATRELHDACLVIKATMGNRHCLFTGDASDENLSSIAISTSNFCEDILHASHHGSINGADLDFIKGCNADYTIISTESGVHPNVPHPTALQRYRNNTNKEVKRTDKDGSWAVAF